MLQIINLLCQKGRKRKIWTGNSITLEDLTDIQAWSYDNKLHSGPGNYDKLQPTASDLLRKFSGAWNILLIAGVPKFT